MNALPLRPLMILVAGPYRSGTNDDPAKMAANVTAMTDVALRLYRAGHLPVVGGGSHCRSSRRRAPRRWGTRSSTRSSTPSRTRSWSGVTPACGSAAPRRERTRWCEPPRSRASRCSTGWRMCRAAVEPRVTPPVQQRGTLMKTHRSWVLLCLLGSAALAAEPQARGARRHLGHRCRSGARRQPDHLVEAGWGSRG